METVLIRFNKPTDVGTAHYMEGAVAGFREEIAARIMVNGDGARFDPEAPIKQPDDGGQPRTTKVPKRSRRK